MNLSGDLTSCPRCQNCPILCRHIELLNLVDPLAYLCDNCCGLIVQASACDRTCNIMDLVKDPGSYPQGPQSRLY